MKVNYKVTGDDRKRLVKAVSIITGSNAVYLGAPTFAYEVGGYHIDKDGVIQGEDNPALVADLCGLYDMEAEKEEYDNPLAEAEPAPDDIHIPYEAELGGRISPYHDFEEPPTYASPDDEDSALLTIEMPREDLPDTAIVNLNRLVESKAALFCKAFGVEPIALVITEDKVKFPWFQNGAEAEVVKAYTHFIAALCDMTKTLKRVTTKEKTFDNEKYAFRCFLLRLGFIGPEYKEERKVLLSRLSGSSAFKGQAGGADDE